MIEVVGPAALGAAARRLMGWGVTRRIAGQLLAAAAALAVMWPHGVWPALVAAAAITLAWGLPWHGESIQRPWLMSARHVVFTTALAAGLSLGFGLVAWWYAPVGLAAGPVYWAARRIDWPTNDARRFFGDWNAYAELGLGALLVGGLGLI